MNLVGDVCVLWCGCQLWILWVMLCLMMRSLTGPYTNQYPCMLWYSTAIHLKYSYFLTENWLHTYTIQLQITVVKLASTARAAAPFWFLNVLGCAACSFSIIYICMRSLPTILWCCLLHGVVCTAIPNGRSRVVWLPLSISKLFCHVVIPTCVYLVVTT